MFANQTYGIGIGTGELCPQNKTNKQNIYLTFPTESQQRLCIYQQPNNKACPSKDIERKNEFKICVIMNEINQGDNNFG